MTPRPCPACAEIAELPEFAGRCINCCSGSTTPSDAAVGAAVDEILHVLALGVRVRAAFRSGRRAEHLQALDLLRCALRVVDEQGLDL